jgi:hypothetical protein
MQYKLFFAEKQYSFRSSSVPNSMILRFPTDFAPTLHRLCTDFGTEEERTYNGPTTALHILISSTSVQPAQGTSKYFLEKDKNQAPNILSDSIGL